MTYRANRVTKHNKGVSVCSSFSCHQLSYTSSHKLLLSYSPSLSDGSLTVPLLLFGSLAPLVIVAFLYEMINKTSKKMVWELDTYRESTAHLKWKAGEGISPYVLPSTSVLSTSKALFSNSLFNRKYCEVLSNLFVSIEVAFRSTSTNNTFSIGNIAKIRKNIYL